MNVNCLVNFRVAVALAALLALAACAGLQPKTPEDVVRERSEARWDALIKRDFDKAGEYTQPAYRALVGQKDYYKRFGGAGQWKGVQIHEVTCEPERCTVRLRLTTTTSTGIPGRILAAEGPSRAISSAGTTISTL